MIQDLRENEEVMLYGELIDFLEIEIKEVRAYLENQFEEESLDYPYQPPDFDQNAAIWGAKTIFLASQLLLYRENFSQDSALIVTPYDLEFTPSAILSADLCLRFLPDVLTQAKMFDAEDPLVDLLKSILKKWHYSNIPNCDDCDQLDFRIIAKDKCLLQLYCNRVVYYKKIKTAKRVELKNLILSNFGFYKTEFWDEFNKEVSLNV